MADGTLIFDTKLDLTEYKKALASLKSKNNSKDIAVKIGVEADEGKARKAARKVKDAAEGENPTIEVGAEADESEARAAAGKVVSAAEGADPTVEVGAEADTGDVRDAVNKVESAAKSADPTVGVGVKVDSSGVDAGVDNAVERVRDSLSDAGDPFDGDGDINLGVKVSGSGGVSSAASGVGSIIKGVLGASVIKEAGTKLLEFGKDAVMAASDLEEVQNVVDVTFGASAEVINDFATNGAKAFGLTEYQTKKYTGTLGALFKSMGLGQDEVTDMSVAMAGLTGDIASFYNLDYDTAFEKLRSGISGETEPLKQLGINLSVANLEAYALAEGIETAYDEMSEAEKATLRYNYILSVTSDAQGDFSRTTDGFANQLRILENNIESLKTRIGSKLIPVVNDALTALNSLFSGGGGSDTSEQTQLLSDINAANESLESVKTNLFLLKNQYANTVLKIQIQYEQSGLLLGEYEQLNGSENLTEEDVARMKEVVAELVGMYPQLEEYVGEDGLFSVEAGEVRALIDDYAELARQKAAATLLSGVAEQKLTAEYEFATLGIKKDESDAQVDALQKQLDQYEEVQRAIVAANKYATGMPLLGALLGGEYAPSTEEVQQMADAVQAYIDVFGGFDESTLAVLSGAGVDLGTFLGSLGDTSELDAGGIQALMNTVQALFADDTLVSSINTTSDQLNVAKEAQSAALQALTEGYDTLQTATGEYDQAMKTFETVTGESAQEAMDKWKGEVESGGATVVTSAGVIGVEVAEGIANKENVGKATAEALGLAADKINDWNAPTVYYDVKPRVTYPTVSGSGGSYDGSHATGLDYVPYDNYLANLHRGESVLRADDAAAWRAAQHGAGGSDALEAVAGALEGVASQPINVFIDSEKVAEAVREPLSYAQNGASRSRALGVGK